MDWTYDLFLEDMKQYSIADSDSDNYRAYFIGKMKAYVEHFKEEWIAIHKYLYADFVGWVGDALMDDDMWDFFSDFYKDAYGQRPHLPKWYYVNAFGLPTSEDVGRTFCATPIQDAIDEAKLARQNF